MKCFVLLLAGLSLSLFACTTAQSVGDSAGEFIEGDPSAAPQEPDLEPMTGGSTGYSAADHAAGTGF